MSAYIFLAANGELCRCTGLKDVSTDVRLGSRKNNCYVPTKSPAAMQRDERIKTVIIFWPTSTKPVGTKTLNI